MKDIVQWDVRSWSKAIRYWDKQVDWNNVKCGLELGGHEGGLSLWLALKGKPVVCSDLKNVKQTAYGLHEKYRVTSLVEYRDIDALDIPYENFFDVIMFKSVIGGVGRNDKPEMQQKMFAQVHKALKPGGKLLFAENLAASPFHQRLRKRFVNWGDSWRYVSIDEVRQFLSGFTSCEIRTTGFLATLGRNEGQRQLFAVMDDVLLLNKLLPDNWKYIVYGIAEK
jgi:SAM-dependent methyltransferase